MSPAISPPDSLFERPLAAFAAVAVDGVLIADRSARPACTAESAIAADEATDREVRRAIEAVERT